MGREVVPGDDPVAFKRSCQSASFPSQLYTTYMTSDFIDFLENIFSGNLLHVEQLARFLPRIMRAKNGIILSFIFPESGGRKGA